jgi:PEP-CTERM motif
MMSRLRRLIFSAAFAPIVLLTLAGPESSARAGTLTYDVIVHSVGISGTSGYLEFSMSDASYPATPSVTATITNVVADGALGAVSPPIGDVTGTLSSPPLTLANDAFSDYQQAYTYGSTMTFTLTFTGSDVGNPTAPSGTLFAILLEDGTGAPLNTGPAGEAADFFFPPLLGAPVVLYPASSPNGFPFITFGSVPEPSSVVLMGLGLCGVVATGRRIKRGA